jgi:hypothetical protein
MPTMVRTARRGVGAHLLHRAHEVVDVVEEDASGWALGRRPRGGQVVAVEQWVVCGWKFPSTSASTAPAKLWRPSISTYVDL